MPRGAIWAPSRLENSPGPKTADSLRMYPRSRVFLKYVCHMSTAKALEIEMAKRKIRPHPGALAELLKRQNMTQTEAAAASGIDRKTLAKIDRGEDVKEDTLQNLAKKLSVPSTYFEPPADDMSCREVSQPDNPRFHNLMLRKVDAEGLAEMLGSRTIHWQLNVHTVDEETVPLLEQLEDAVERFSRVPTGRPTLEQRRQLKSVVG